MANRSVIKEIFLTMGEHFDANKVDLVCIIGVGQNARFDVVLGPGIEPAQVLRALKIVISEYEQAMGTADMKAPDIVIPSDN